MGGRRGRILIVDDEDGIRNLLSNYLGSRDFQTAQASGVEEALTLLSRSPFDLVLTDIQMPGRSGISLLAEIRKTHPQVGVLMLTGCGDVSIAVQSMKSGASDYVLKPFELERVEGVVEQALQRREELIGQAERTRKLEETVATQTNQLRLLLNDLDQASEHTLAALVNALDAREHETKAHSRRVAEYTMLLARELGVTGEALENIRRGSLLHDIGKIGVSDRILMKPDRLTDAEWDEMRRHPSIGSWILNGVERLRPAAAVVLSHHERFDGKGYPQGLMREAIPLGARIFSVADSLDAITSDRPYHRGHSFESAREEIAANAGAQFDPRVVESFLSLEPHLWRGIRERSLSEEAEPALAPAEATVKPCRQSSS